MWRRGAFFAKKKAEHNWLNDIDEELINVYATLRDKPELLAALLGSKGVSPSVYRCILYSKPRTEVARAAKWLYIALTSYPQTLNLKQNLHKFNESAHIDLSSATYKLRDVRLTSMDFENVINDAPNGAFLFIDPPYSIRNSKLKRNTYLHKFSGRDHLRLARALRDRCKEIKFMLFYKENSYVERLFSFDASVSKRMLVSQIVRQTMKGRKPVAIRESYKEMVFMNYGKSMAVEHSRK